MKTHALLRAELAEITLTGPRARVATAAALSTGLAVLLALWLRLDNIWWAGISGFVCSQAGRPASVSKATFRVVGTLVGAVIGLLGVAWLIADYVPCLAFLFCCGMLGILGSYCSPHSYVWLLGSITAAMVVTSSMTEPGLAVHVATYRSIEIVVGSFAALLVAFGLHEPTAAPPPAVPPHAWSDALTMESPVLAHAARTGFALMLVPLTWNWLDLPGVSQMAVSITAVMAVPALGSTASEGRSAVLGRALHRVLGCIYGGIAGLALLALSIQSLLGWLLLLMPGVWLCAYVNQSQRGVSYVAFQASIALIVTMMQGWTPPLSLLPAIERLAGMLGGLALLLLVLLVTWTDPPPPESPGPCIDLPGVQS